METSDCETMLTILKRLATIEALIQQLPMQIAIANQLERERAIKLALRGQSYESSISKNTEH